MKQKIKTFLFIFAFVGAYSIVGEMDYQDVIAQHKINCQSATYSYDNNLECTK